MMDPATAMAGQAPEPAPCQSSEAPQRPREITERHPQGDHEKKNTECQANKVVHFRYLSLSAYDGDSAGGTSRRASAPVNRETDRCHFCPPVRPGC